MSDLISRQAAIEAVHKSIYDFFDICDDDEESPMTYKDKLLLEVNKAITTQIKAVASAQPIDIDAIIKAHADIGYEQGYRDGYAEAEPIKHGRWITEPIQTSARVPFPMERCSVCDRLSIERTNYCPNCGADMREVEE